MEERIWNVIAGAMVEEQERWSNGRSFLVTTNSM